MCNFITASAKAWFKYLHPKHTHQEWPKPFCRPIFNFDFLIVLFNHKIIRTGKFSTFNQRSNRIINRKIWYWGVTKAMLDWCTQGTLLIRRSIYISFEGYKVPAQILIFCDLSYQENIAKFCVISRPLLLEQVGR